MKTDKKSAASSPASSADAPVSQKSPLGLMVGLLIVLLALIFWRLFDPAQVMFSNDGPFGGMVAELNRMPSILRGVWANSNWFGNESISPPLSVSSFLRLFTTPLIYAKILCPFALFIAGIGACFCFRKLKLAPMACILGGLAAAMNSDFFSTSCWGVCTQIIGFGFMYLAIGLLSDTSKNQWIRVILAGFAVGIGVMEAYDIGALFSLFVAAYAVYQALFLDETPRPVAVKLGRGVLRTGLVAAFAGFIAVHTLLGLVGTQIKGVSGMEQDEATRAARWEGATYFSLPKAETLQILVPGIYGFRDSWYMYEYDEPKEDQYWGSIGQMPGLQHLIGTGFYAGVPVVLIALWAIFQAFRGDGSPFTKFQRRAIWFWSVSALISLLFSYGKHAPFYQLFYSIPYASTIRNPVKFMHVFTWALVIIFAYGVHGFYQLYFKDYVERVGGVVAQYKNWLSKAASFERKWIFGCVVTLILSLIAWLIYLSSKPKLVAYMQSVGVPAPGTPGANSDSNAVAGFSIASIGWFILLFVLTLGLFMLIFSGQFSGSRARWGGIALGALMLFDLGRADVPWIVYWDLNYKYMPDPIVNFLAEKPYEQRIAVVPADYSRSPQLGMLMNAYGNDWKQHLFLSKNIQCADVVQEPRVAVDKEMYMSAIGGNLLRFWTLCNTRYLLGPADWVKQLSMQQPGAERLFRVIKTFNFVPKRSNPSLQWPADYRSELDPNGQLAVIEYLGALPRAKLYSNWQVNTNEMSTLQTLAGQGFDPQQSVLVMQNIPAPAPADAAQAPGAVEIDPNYKSKRIELKADAKVPAVLLLSERYNDKWHVEVDGKPTELLRCDFIERGVFLPKGQHTIVMHYEAPTHTLYISLAAVVLGLGLWGFLIVAPRKDKAASNAN